MCYCTTVARKLSNDNSAKFFALPRCDFDVFHNAVPVFARVRDADLAVVFAVTLPCAVSGGLQQDGERFPDLRIQIHKLHLVCDALRLAGAALLDGVGQLVRHGGRLRAGADGIGENVHLRKADLPDESKRCGVVILRLAGEARDKVRRQRAAGEGLPQQRRRAAEAGGVILPVHRRERAVAAAL